MNSTQSSIPKPVETRRTFLRKTATLAAVTSAPTLFRSSLYGQSQAPSVNVTGANNRIVLGVIGTGKQGAKHLQICKELATGQNIKVGAVCDLYQKHLEGAKKFTGLADSDAHRDHRRVIERKDIDAVIIAAVDNWHADVTLDALAVGKHVYCEKPMTRYASEGFTVYDAVKRTGKVYQCGSQWSADSMIRKAAEWVKQGKLGPLVWAQASYCRNNKQNSEWSFPIDDDANPSNLDWERWQGKATKIPWTPDRFFSWHKYYAYGSGILGNLLTHRFFPLMLATGNPEFPRRVTCTGTRKISTDREVSDTSHVLADFPSGLTFAIAGSTVNEQGWPDMIRGRKASLYLAASQNKIELRPERIFAEEIDNEDWSDTSPYARVENLHTNFYDCVRNGGTPYCNVDLAIRVNTVICLAEMSERLGLTLFFDEKTRSIKTGDGKVIPPLSYDTVVPPPPVA